MGKSKQRTKNNAKPSNSQRSADLLADSGFSFSGFSGFGEGGFVSYLKNVDMNHVDPTFQLLLRKMNKKDCTTKYKALQEFAELCQSSELSTVEATLPFWPRLYCSLAIDVEHRVREAAQIAHAALVKRVGKKIATHLKQLAGAWFVSQYDTYPPASSAAQNSFNETFPPNKIVSAIIHCQDEILNYIWRNVIKETAQSLSVNKSLTPEEMEAKHHRVLISSLQAYAAYLKAVDQDAIVKKADTHRQILNDGKFWKLGKHSDVLVKAAFYNVLTAVLGHADYLLKDDTKKVISAVMNNIDENEPPLVIAIWEAVVVVINSIKDWHKMVNVEKGVLSKLYFILKNSGQNCASIVYPNLLPLLSHLMKLDIDKKMLYTRLFENMREGLESKKVAVSRSEVQMIMVTFFECFRYIIHNNNSDLELCTGLVNGQLIPVIRTTLSDTFSQRNSYYTELASLIQYWSKNKNVADSNCYSKLITSFWTELSNLYKEVQDLPNHSSCLTNFTNLLVSLKNAPVKMRKNVKVTFADCSEIERDNSTVQIQMQEADKKFVGEVEDFIITFCKSYFDRVVETPSLSNYEDLIKLASKFESKRFFEGLAVAHNADGNLFQFYEENVRKWMLENKEEAKGVVPLIFSMASYVGEQDKSRILVSLFEFEDEILLFHALKCVLNNKNRESKAVKEWCRNEKITQLLVEIARNLVASKSNDKYPQMGVVLRLAFKMTNDGELLVSVDAIDKVSTVICNALKNICSSPSDYIPSYEVQSETQEEEVEDETSYPTEPVIAPYTILLNLVKLSSDLLEITLEHGKILPGSVEILKTMLILNITDELTDQLEIEAEFLQNALHNVMPKMPHSQFVDFTKNFATVLWNKIFDSMVSLRPKYSNGVKIKDSLLNMASMFLKVIYENSENDEFHDLALLFLSALDTKSWMKNVYEIILSAKIMNGHLYVPGLQLEVNIWNENCTVNIINDKVDDCMDKCLTWAVASMKILNKLNNSIEAENAVDVPDVTTNIIDVIKLGRKYKTYYKSNKLFNDVNLLLENLQVEFDVKRPSKKFYSEDISDTLNQIETSTIPDNEDIHSLISIRRMDSEEEERATFNRLMDKIVQRHALEPSLLLQECNIHSASWENLTLPLEFIRTITYFIKKYPTSITTFQWDFILISLASWQSSINQSNKHFNDFKVMTFSVAVCQMYSAVQTLMSKHEKEPIEEFPPELLDEWKNVFMEIVHIGIAKTWMLYADLYNTKEIPLMAIVPLETIAKAMQLIDVSIFFKDTQEKSVNYKELMKICFKLLQSPILTLQLSAYHALHLVIVELIKMDKSKIEGENIDAKSLNVYLFEDPLVNMKDVLDEMLKDLKLCNTSNIPLKPHSDAYIATVGYLFAWMTILDMCANAGGDLRYHYAEMLRENHFSSLMTNIFKLVPNEVLFDNKVKYPKLVEIFSNAPSFSFEESWNSARLDHLVCWVYANCLRYLRVLVRQWWSTTESRVSVTVDRITTTYVSPMLCQEELSNTELVNIENIQIKIHHSIREVIAMYEMDDRKLELNITLPANYPLGPVTVASGQNFKANANWSNCHMQLSLFLTHQNGSICDGLMLWKKNLDKRFTGVEECYICFSILHFNTFQIPKLSCRTCKKKFHTHCLYKWFNTSQKSTCPICRNVF